MTTANALQAYREATDEAHAVYVNTTTLAWEYYQAATVAAWNRYKEQIEGNPDDSSTETESG